jgi:hypothetical protein
MEKYVEWAAKHYAGEKVPSAIDLASICLEDGEFLLRQEELGGNAEDSQWDECCREHDCLFWNDECACVTDGYYHVRQYVDFN